MLARAEKLLPGHVPTLMKQAALHAQDGQWAEAVERLRQVLAERPDKEVSVEANLRLAAILDERLNDSNRALGHLDAALSHDPGHRAALERLVQIQARRGQYELAADTAVRLVRVSPEVQGRVAALTLLGRLERERGQTDAAIHAYEQVVALVGTEGPAAGSYASSCRPRARVSSAATSRRSLDTPRARRCRPWASSWSSPRCCPNACSNASRRSRGSTRGLAAHPDDATLRAELASTLLAAGQHQRALAELLACSARTSSVRTSGAR